MSREQLTQLARPFPAKYVKKPAPGKYGTYVDHEIVTQALLFIVGPFSFQVEQVFYNPDGILDRGTAALTCTIDGREVTITEAGDCENPTVSKTQGDRLKKATSDALKRCAMRLGLGIHLWAGTDGDFFLFDNLTKNAEVGHGSGGTRTAAAASDDGRALSAGDAQGSRPLPASAPSPDAESVGAAGSSSTFHGDGPAISRNRRDALKARCVALQADGVSVADAREELHLPLVDSCNEEQMKRFEAMVEDLEARLMAPFQKASA